MTAQNRKRIKTMRVDNITTTSKDNAREILSPANDVQTLVPSRQLS